MRERTLQDICDVTPTLSQPQITPVLRGNFGMQGPSDGANCDSLINMVTLEYSSHCSNRSQKVDYTGIAGSFSVCSAPCSSCFLAHNVLLKSNNESAGDTCVGNTVTGQLSILTVVGEMESTSDSFSENAAGKDSSRASDASASSDSVVHSKRDGWRSLKGHDDCLSCVSGTDEQVNRKSDAEDCEYNRKNKIGCEISRKVSPSSSQTDFLITKSVDDATGTQKVQNTSQSSNDKNLICEESLMNVNDDKPSDTKVELLKPSVDHINSSSLNCVASDNICGDPPKTDQDSTEKNDEMEVETHPVEESDDSDMVEQDVKVCDICGDAGREDLLAICSRCSDGAEHTYCMREMLEKLPEGEWLCEECKTLELVENTKQEKIGSMDENEKTYSFGQAIESLNNSDVEGDRTKSSTKIPSKRIRDDEDAEVSSVAKKPALESTVGSLKTSNSRVAVLSRESSLKHLEKGRQSPNRSMLDTVPVNDAKELTKPASDARGLNLRGNFGKCNSFSSLNSKPKVKLVDQVIIQRQKSVKEHGPFRLKEGAVRSTGKSMSFRSTNSNCSESKLKMISPRSSPVQDGKLTNERIVFDRQGSFRTEHPSNNSAIGTSMKSTSKLDNRPSSRVESSSIAMPSIHHEVKQAQTDSKSAALLRSSSFAARRTAELPSSTGGFERPSKHVPNTSVLSSANRVSNTEQKYNQTSLKQDPASCPGVSEKLPVNASEGLSDGLVQSKDITDGAHSLKEYSGSRFGSPSMRSSRGEGDHLKAAIEAAVLRKPGVYRKHKSSGQSDESFVLTVAPVASHIDSMSSLRNRKLFSNAELSGRPEVSRNSTANPPREETHNSVKQSSLVPAEGFSSVGCEGVHVDLSLRDTFSNVPAAIPLMPEHEYIWQGSFEICQSGQTFELWDGIQAHLSTCASPKVVEAVNKLRSRIILNEVSRASMWPVQFQENGVGEDNIALFFFAKDLQSHDKIYKVLLENMMKNDLALKGNINDVELLIFPSNMLPVNFQRWNMLFFLWGVFRGKKESNQRQKPESALTPRNIPPPIMSLSENRCSLRPITENASEDLRVGLEVPALKELPDSARVVKRNSDIHVSPADQLVHGLSSILLSAVQSDCAKQCGDVSCAYQEAGMSSSCSHPVAMSKPVTGSEQWLMQPDTTLVMPQEGIGEGAILEKNCHVNQLKIRNDAIDLSTEGEIPSEDETSTRDLNMEPKRRLINQKEPMFQQPSSSGHRSPRNDDMQNETCRTPEKANHVPYQHGKASVGTIPKQCKDTERYLSPVESQPVKADDGSMPWKTYHLDENRSIDRASNLDLALGAEGTPLTLENHILEEEAIKKKAEDDVSASLSLSLPFSFAENEVDAKPSPKTEQLLSQRGHVNTSSRLLSGNLRENKINSVST